MANCRAISVLISVLLGVVLILLGTAILVFIFPAAYKKKVEESLSISEGSEAADRLVKSPVPSYMSFYFFNVTNKEEAINGSKPILKEVGPYVFRQEKVKEIIDWDSKIGTVSYTENTTYHYEPLMTPGNLNDRINHMDIVTVGVFEKMLSLNFFEPSMPLPGKLIDTHSVDELLFRGFSIDDYLPFGLGPILKEPPFGFYLDKNVSQSLKYEVSTGVIGMKNLGEIISYNDSRYLHFWGHDYCNSVNGSDGKQFPPGVKKDDQFYVFSSDVCRSLKIKYDKETTVEQIDALQFTVAEEVFADPNVYKDNMCFCNQAKDDICPSKAGVFMVSVCQENKPVAMSAPHFYLGSKEYVDKFIGLNPTKVKHQTFLDIEPVTGTVISAAKRIQVNAVIVPHREQPFFDHIKENFLYFPIFWVEEGGQIDPKSAAEFRDKVVKPYNTVKYSMIAAISVGGVILLLVMVTSIFSGKNEKEYDMTKADSSKP